MNTPDFVEKYCGQEVKIINTDKTLSFGHIIGYCVPGSGNVYHGQVLIRISRGIIKEYHIRAAFSNNWVIKAYIPTNEVIAWSCRFPQDIELVELPTPSNKPDDCDDCGAIGNESCKSDCPNKD